MDDSSTCLIIFVRDPVLGKVKSRLAATIGEDQALKVYKILLEHTHSITAGLNCVRYVYYADKVNPTDIWNKGYIKRAQTGHELGERMANAFNSAFHEGYRQVIIIGSDCYELSTEMIVKAFEYLDHYDTVIGPAGDGGYYLLGLSKFVPAIFNGKAWSTDTVCSDTLKDIDQADLSCKLLPVLNDVDVAEDLERCNIPLSDS